MIFKNSQNEIIYVASSSFASNVSKEDANILVVDVKRDYFDINLYTKIIDTSFEQLVKNYNTKYIKEFFDDYKKINNNIALLSPSLPNNYLMNEEDDRYTSQVINIFEKPNN